MRNSLKYIFLTALFVLVLKDSNSQVIADFNDITIFMAEKQKSSSNVENFIKTKSGKLLCIQNQTSLSGVFSRHNSKQTFNFISDYTLPEGVPVTFYGKGKKSSLTHYTILGDNILSLSAQSSIIGSGSEVYYHIINPYSQGKSNHGFSLNDDFFFDQEIDISHLTLVSSPDKQFASIVYVQKKQSDEYSTVKYLNFKENSPEQEGGGFIYPFLKNEYEFLDFYIKDQKNQFIVAGHFFEAQQRNSFINQEKYFQALSVGKVSNQEFKYVMIEGDGNFFTEVGMYQSGENLVISGLYSPFIDGNVIGVFTIKIDNEGQVIEKVFARFSDLTVTSIEGLNTTFMEDQSIIRSEYKGFEFKHFEATKGGYIGIAEFNALEYRYSGTDVPGASSTVDSYYWSNDIIVFKLDSVGALIWDVQIPKYQRSINDGGYFLSSAFYFSEQKAHLFFNDNLMNYDEDGDYQRNGDAPFATQYNSGRNTIGHVSINLESGFMSRKSTIGKEESDLLFIPLLSTRFYESNKLMIYARSGNKHRIGSIGFRN